MKRRAAAVSFDWRTRLRQRDAWLVIARHTVPILGVAFLGWSAARGILAIFLDTLAALYCLAGIGAFYIARESVPAISRWTDALRLVFSGLFAWAFGCAVVTFAAGVLFFFMWTILLSREFSLGEMLASAWFWRTLAFMLALQVPRFVWILRHNDRDQAEQGTRKSVPAVLIRFALIVSACTFIDALPGRVGLVAGLVVAQAVLAAVEIYGDVLLQSSSEHRRAMADAARAEEESRRTRP